MSSQQINVHPQPINKSEKSSNICYLTNNQDPVHPMDLLLHYGLARLTGGISPASLLLAWLDWALHLSFSPGKQTDLIRVLENQIGESLYLGTRALQNQSLQESDSIVQKDHRFRSDQWNQWPFNMYCNQFLQSQNFWHQATTGVRGVTIHHENVISFAARQWLDMLSPSNFLLTNPELQRKSVEQAGINLAKGYQRWWLDLLELTKVKACRVTNPDLPFKPGASVAVSEGCVVFRNHLLELIQYSPKTAKVNKRPVLIVPSWIMKYYILDLSPENSFVRFLTEQGYTVFMISWRNPDQSDRDIGMNDYIQSGFYAALNEVSVICDQNPVHTIGYCLGGTLLAMAIADLSNTCDTHTSTVATMTLLAAQTDFTEPGELGLFIDESQLAMLDALMWKQGYLDGPQMAGSFQFLNSRDLFWSKNMRRYLLGEEEKTSDLMSWNADTTRMPYRMHSEYLKHLFLHNDLAQGRYQLNDAPLNLKAINIPVFVTATETDHVSPWHSVYKIHHLTDTSVEFVLASGGHNAGIIAAPDNPKCSYRFNPASPVSQLSVSADEWLAKSTKVSGSWWEHWSNWIKLQGQEMTEARQISRGIAPAPGTYVFQY